MKPSIFIGSSVEGLSIAYALQQNLQFSANVTVWDQGIFELSSNALDDLIKALDEFDFGIFVFKPDDLTVMRANQYSTVRDNVLFEFGLFIGRLGKNKVFFLLPRNSQNLHLPSDLEGLSKGTYDNDREDGRLQAALGPFCTQVKQQIDRFIYDEKYELTKENKKVKSIVLNKPIAWEFELAAEFLSSKLVPINRRFIDLINGRSYIPEQYCDAEEYLKFYRNSLSNIVQLIGIFEKLYLQDMEISFGKPGVTGDVQLIKDVTDKMISVCNDLLSWEQQVQQYKPPEELMEVRTIMRGWSQLIVGQINKLPSELMRIVDASRKPFKEEEIIKIELVFNEPPRLQEATRLFEKVFGKF